MNPITVFSFGLGLIMTAISAAVIIIAFHRNSQIYIVGLLAGLTEECRKDPGKYIYNWICMAAYIQYCRAQNPEGKLTDPTSLPYSEFKYYVRNNHDWHSLLRSMSVTAKLSDDDAFILATTVLHFPMLVVDRFNGRLAGWTISQLNSGVPRPTGSR